MVYWVFFSHLTLLFCLARFLKMYTALKKIHKDKDAEASEFEETVAQVVLLENIDLFVYSIVKVALRSSLLALLMIVCICRHSLIWKTPIRSWKVTLRICTLIQRCKCHVFSVNKLSWWNGYIVSYYTNTCGLFGCSQVDVSGNRKAVVIYVPFRLRKAFRKIQLRLVRELEKKFSGKVTDGLLLFLLFSSHFPKAESFLQFFYH